MADPQLGYLMRFGLIEVDRSERAALQELTDRRISEEEATTSLWLSRRADESG
jgi:hypothetical protein